MQRWPCAPDLWPFEPQINRLRHRFLSIYRANIHAHTQPHSFTSWQSDRNTCAAIPSRLRGWYCRRPWPRCGRCIWCCPWCWRSCRWWRRWLEVVVYPRLVPVCSSTPGAGVVVGLRRRAYTQRWRPLSPRLPLLWRYARQNCKYSWKFYTKELLVLWHLVVAGLIDWLLLYAVTGGAQPLSLNWTSSDH